MHGLGLGIDGEIAARLPEIAVTALLFEDAALGMPTRKIEPMRERVIAAARERVAAVRDPRRLPAIAALHGAFPDIARTVKRLWLDDALRAIARHDPFPVVNDLVDTARLLAIHYETPMSALDLAKVRPPVRLVIAPDGASARTASGAVGPVGGLPVLVDATGIVASPCVEVARAQPGRQTRSLALVAYAPVREGAPDPADFRTRAANWLSALAGARLVTTESAGGT